MSTANSAQVRSLPSASEEPVTVSVIALRTLQEAAHQTEGLKCEIQKLKDKLAAVEGRVARLNAVVKTASPLTPFDCLFLETVFASQGTFCAPSCRCHPQQLLDAPGGLPDVGFGHHSATTTATAADLRSDTSQATEQLTTLLLQNRAALSNVSTGVAQGAEPSVLAWHVSYPAAANPGQSTATSIDVGRAKLLMQTQATAQNVPSPATSSGAAIVPASTILHGAASLLQPQASVQAAPSSIASLAAAVNAEAPIRTILHSAASLMQPKASVQSAPSPAVPATEAAEASSVSAAVGAAAVRIPAKQLPSYTDVDMVVSKGALQGWVEQASPCCGAASVAGAWNAIRPAGTSGASKEDVLQLYALKWRRSIDQACAALADVLQVEDIAPLYAAIQAAWPFTDQTWVEGQPAQGSLGKPSKPTNAAALQLLQQSASDHMAHYPTDSPQIAAEGLTCSNHCSTGTGPDTDDAGDDAYGQEPDEQSGSETIQESAMPAIVLKHKTGEEKQLFPSQVATGPSLGGLRTGHRRRPIMHGSSLSKRKCSRKQSAKPEPQDVLLLTEKQHQQLQQQAASQPDVSTASSAASEQQLQASGGSSIAECIAQAALVLPETVKQLMSESDKFVDAQHNSPGIESILDDLQHGALAAKGVQHAEAQQLQSGSAQHAARHAAHLTQQSGCSQQQHEQNQQACLTQQPAEPLQQSSTRQPHVQRQDSNQQAGSTHQQVGWSLQLDQSRQRCSELTLLEVAEQQQQQGCNPEHAVSFEQQSKHSVQSMEDLQDTADLRQLWQRLSEGLADPQTAHKLAQLTVTLLARMRGYWNLTKGRPSTAPIGNDALMAALRQLSQQHGQDLAVWKFMSAGKQRAEHKVREADSAETVTQQWLALMALLRDSNSSVLYHMENHYCLIFAGRSWHMDAGYGGCKHVRQVLVARPGQKPCAWVSFDVLRSNLLSWHGYALMAATRREDIVLSTQTLSDSTMISLDVAVENVRIAMLSEVPGRCVATHNA